MGYCNVCGGEIKGNNYTNQGGGPRHLDVVVCVANLAEEITLLRGQNARLEREVEKVRKEVRRG